MRRINTFLRGLYALLLFCAIPHCLLAGDLKIAVLSVGSGDSSLIIFPNNKLMLIDTGVPGQTDSIVIPFLQRHGITHLDYFMGTHVHPDHTDGIPNLENAGYIDAATVVWDWNDFDIYDSLTVEGTEWFISNARDVAANGNDTNDNSIGYRIESNGFIYSGSGDEGVASVNRFLSDHPTLVPAHVRNTAHHGWGANSTSYLTALDADLYIVSGPTDVLNYNSGYKRIKSVADSLGAVTALTHTCNNGSRGHIYIRASSGSDWDYSFFPINNTIPDFYTPSQNDSKFISQSVPETLMPGQTATVSITLENIGPATWSTAAGHRLGSQSPADNSTWTGANRIELPHDVATGEQVTFTFDITAPTTIDFYDFQWQMIDIDEPDALLRWFGSSTPNIPLDVTWPLTNLVQNHSFELDNDSNNRPDSWGNDADYTYSDEQASEGSFSAKGAGNGSIGGISQTISIEPNTDYELSVDIYFASGTGEIHFDTNDKFDSQGTQSDVMAPNGGWITYKSSFNSGVETSVRLRNYTQNLVNAVFYIDNVSLTTRGLFEIPNLPPTFTSSPGLYAETGSVYSYTITTSDPDEDSVSLSATNKPAWLNLSGNVLSGTPTTTGPVSVTLRASDAEGYNEQTFSLTVSAPGNDAPVITSPPNTAAIKDTFYSYTILGNDPDGDNLTYGLPIKPDWLSISDNIVSGTPPTGEVIVPITVSVNDGNATVTQAFNLAVFPTPQPANLLLNGSFEDGTSWPDSWSTDPNAVWTSASTQDGAKSLLIPTDIGSVSQSVTLNANQTYYISLWVNAAGFAGTGATVFDSWDQYDGTDQAQFVIDSIDDADGWTRKTGSFTATESGTVRFRIFSTAGTTGNVYFDNIVLSTAGSGNATPIFTSNPITSVDMDAPYYYAVWAADAEVGALTFSAITLPSWLSFDTETAELTGTPTFSNIGVHPVEISVSDGSATASQTFSITVNATVDLNSDDDHDGVPYLLEVALGGNPNSPDADVVLPISMRDGNDFNFSFKRADAGISYVVQKSNTLGGWLDLTTVNDSHGSVGNTVTVPISASEMEDGKLFLRLKVSD